MARRRFTDCHADEVLGQAETRLAGCWVCPEEVASLSWHGPSRLLVLVLVQGGRRRRVAQRCSARRTGRATHGRFASMLRWPCDGPRVHGALLVLPGVAPGAVWKVGAVLLPARQS
jgi:hypothetical protein